MAGPSTDMAPRVPSDQLQANFLAAIVPVAILIALVTLQNDYGARLLVSVGIYTDSNILVLPASLSILSNSLPTEGICPLC